MPFYLMWLRSLVKLTLQPQLTAAELFLLEIGQVGDSSGIFPVRGRLELSKRDHEAGGGRAGKVTRWRKKVRAVGQRSCALPPNPQVSPVARTSEVQVLFAAVKLTSKLLYVFLNLYPSS